MLTPMGNIVGPEGLVRADEFTSYIPKGVTLSPCPGNVVGEWDVHGRRIRDEIILQDIGEAKVESDEEESGRKKLKKRMRAALARVT